MTNTGEARRIIEPNIKLFIAIVLILIIALSIGNRACYLSKKFRDLGFRNRLYQSQLDSVL
jgi:hypothetical protein